jgi:hypothetical protein
MFRSEDGLFHGFLSSILQRGRFDGDEGRDGSMLLIDGYCVMRDDFASLRRNGGDIYRFFRRGLG